MNYETFLFPSHGITLLVLVLESFNEIEVFFFSTTILRYKIFEIRSRKVYRGKRPVYIASESLRMCIERMINQATISNYVRMTRGKKRNRFNRRNFSLSAPWQTLLHESADKSIGSKYLNSINRRGKNGAGGDEARFNEVPLPITQSGRGRGTRVRPIKNNRRYAAGTIGGRSISGIREGARVVARIPSANHDLGRIYVIVLRNERYAAHSFIGIR